MGKMGQPPDRPPAAQRFVRAVQACRRRHKGVSPAGFYMLVAATLADSIDDDTWDTALGVAIATKLDPSTGTQTRPVTGIPAPSPEYGPVTGRSPTGSHLTLVGALSAGGQPGRRRDGDEGEVALYPQQICGAPSSFLPPPYACVTLKAECDGEHHRFRPLDAAATLTPVES